MVKVKKSNVVSKLSRNKSPKVHKKNIANILPLHTKLDGKKNKKILDSTGFEVTCTNELTPFKHKSKLKKTTNTSGINIKNNNKILKNYNIKIKDVESAINSVINLHLQNPKIKNQLFGNECFPISLGINCHRIPKGHQTILRIPLKNTLVTPEDEICLIVSEVKGIGNKEHEKHVEHYENLLSKKGVTNINKIMTVHEFKTEYETFEQKSRLVDLYDAFLVCGKVSGKVVKRCGKVFYKKRKVPTAVKLQSTNLKEHINKQLSKAFFHLHLKGDFYNVQVGHNKMEIQRIIENVASVVEFLDQKFPGGFDNIKGLHIAAERSTSIPIYMSIKSPSDIPKVSVNISNQKFVPQSVKGELTTQLNAEVLVKPDGQVIVTRNKQSFIED